MPLFEAEERVLMQRVKVKNWTMRPRKGRATAYGVLAQKQKAMAKVDVRVLGLMQGSNKA